MGSTKAKKGFMRHFRYLWLIFDNNKEPEMQIGLPTDVKHVAHIGWDGPNVNNPSWMKDYHSAPLSAPGGEDGRESPAALMAATQDLGRRGGIEDCPVARESPCESPDLNPTSTKKKHSRRPQSEGNMPSDSAAAAEGTRRSRKPKKKEASADSMSQDHPAIPKQPHRRRSKSSSKSKAAAPALDPEAEDPGARSSPAVNRTAEE